MHANRKIAAVERVATGLHETLVAEFQSPVEEVEVACEWTGEDFNRIVLVTSSAVLNIVVTSAVGEEGADVRVVVFDSGARGFESLGCGACACGVGRVARAVAAVPAVDGAWPDEEWPKTFLVSVRPEEVDS